MPQLGVHTGLSPIWRAMTARGLAVNPRLVGAIIAAAGLLAGPGTVAAAIAAADPTPSAAGPDSATGADRDPETGADPDPAAGADPDPETGAGPTHRNPRAGHRGSGGEPSEWHCDQRGAPFGCAEAAVPARSPGGSGSGALPAAPLAPRAPVAVISGGVERQAAAGLETPDAPEAVGAPPPASAAPGGAPSASLVPAPAAQPSWQPPPGPTAAPTPAAVQLPPAPVAIPAPPAAAPAPQPRERGRPPGLPEGLPAPGVGSVAAQALPGLAAILGMTALGGVLGYRQAKAGQMLPAAGAARFLR